MDIALLHYSAPPVVGGVETVLGQHARLMTAAGHSVRVIAGRGAEGAVAGRFVSIALADSRHPRVLAAKAELDAGRVPAGFSQLVAELSAGMVQALAGADVVVAHNVCSLHKNLALTAALRALHRRPGFPRLVQWHHDLAWTTPRYQAELHPGYPWDLLRSAWPGVQHVVVSDLRQRELAELMDLPPERIRVVPNGVDSAQFFKLEPQTRALVGALNLEALRPLLLLPVRLTPRKNVELALAALAALRKGWGPFSRAGLLVTGPEGPHNPANAAYYQRLLALRDELGLAGAAHFVAQHTREFLPDAVVADFYRLADALILPSREEGFGIPLIEAALARLPVFCADIPPLRALAGDDATYFAPDAAPELVATAIAVRLGADRVYRFAARARATYSWERVYADFIEPVLHSTGTLNERAGV